MHAGQYVRRLSALLQPCHLQLWLTDRREGPTGMGGEGCQNMERADESVRGGGSIGNMECGEGIQERSGTWGESDDSKCPVFPDLSCQKKERDIVRRRGCQIFTAFWQHSDNMPIRFSLYIRVFRFSVVGNYIFWDSDYCLIPNTDLLRRLPIESKWNLSKNLANICSSLDQKLIFPPIFLPL